MQHVRLPSLLKPEDPWNDDMGYKLDVYILIINKKFSSKPYATKKNTHS